MQMNDRGANGPLPGTPRAGIRKFESHPRLFVPLLRVYPRLIPSRPFAVQNLVWQALFRSDNVGDFSTGRAVPRSE
jgi:hypothetical protein